MKISFFLKLVILTLFFVPLSIQAQGPATPPNVMQMTKINLANNPTARIITTKGVKNSQYTTPEDLKEYATNEVNAKITYVEAKIYDIDSLFVEKEDGNVFFQVSAGNVITKAKYVGVIGSLGQNPFPSDNNGNLAVSSFPFTASDDYNLYYYFNPSDFGNQNISGIWVYFQKNKFVTSVNGQTGAVTITSPVRSVNGQTGAVTVSAGEMKYKQGNLVAGIDAHLGNFNADNIAIGTESMKNNVSGYSNTAIGVATLQQNTTGVFNTVLGKYALQYNTTGTRNVAIGVGALTGGTGSYNICIGGGAGNSIRNGNNNIYIVANNGNNQADGAINTTNALNIGGWITGNNGKIAFTQMPTYANDAAADADTTLASGGLYRISGNRTVYAKP